MLKKIDTDGDGKVSKAEALAAAAARFDKADANKDGFLTVEEMKAARHGHGGHRN
jgi:Ca2+-binding EF-hand superfamily protein